MMAPCGSRRRTRIPCSIDRLRAKPRNWTRTRPISWKIQIRSVYCRRVISFEYRFSRTMQPQWENCQNGWQTLPLRRNGVVSAPLCLFFWKDQWLLVVSNDENDDEKKKPSGATGFDQGIDSTASPAKKSKTSARPACPYGATCYRKNPTHRTEQSHPGDSDYDEKDENDSKTTNSDDKPICPYGKTCYRKNPQHRSDYQHWTVAFAFASQFCK